MSFFSEDSATVTYKTSLSISITFNVLTHSFIHSQFTLYTDQCGNARTHGQITSKFPVHKQVGGYMRSDNVQLPSVQPPTSSYKLQLPHGRHCDHGCHGHGGHGGHGEHGGHGTMVDL